MRHSGAIVEADPSTVAPPFGRDGRYRGTGRAFRRGIRRASSPTRFATKWRPEPREKTVFDRAVPLFLTFVAVAVWVACGFRIGSPHRVATGTLFAAGSSVLQVALLVGAACVAAALTGGGFGDLRSALLKFSGIVLACMGAGAVFGQWVGLVVNVVTFVALMTYLFDVEPIDAAILWAFHIVVSVALTLAAAAVFAA